MTIKEIIEKNKGQFIDYEVYKFKSKKHSLHTDFITALEEYSENEEINDVFSGLMDKEDYSATVLANSSISWEDYGFSKTDKILVIVIKEK